MKKLILIATAFAAALTLPINTLNAAETKNIVEVAAGAGQFNTLVAAVKAAGLVDTLSGAGPFTVFAPTDEAFAKLPAGTVENLLKPENKEKLARHSHLPRARRQGHGCRCQNHERQDCERQGSSHQGG